MPHWWEGDTKEGFTAEEVFKLGLVDRSAVERKRRERKRNSLRSGMHGIELHPDSFTDTLERSGRCSQDEG